MAMEFSNGVSNILTSVSAFAVPTVAASFSFWVRLTSLVGNIRRFMGSGGDFEIRAGNGAGTQPAGQVVNDLFNGSDGALAVTLLTVGPWYHIVGTGELNAGNSITDIYIDGVLDAGPTTVVGSTPVAAALTIGNRTGGGVGEGLNGVLDDVRVYNRRLSAAEVQTIHAARGQDSILDGLVTRLLFEEGGPGSSPAGVGSVKDLSNNQNHYTPTGSPLFSESVLSKRRRLVA